MAATTPPACAAPATRRQTRKRSRNSASSPTATPPSTAATRQASSTSSPSRGRNQFRGAAFEFFRNEIAERQALGAAGNARPRRIRSIATSTAARSAGRSGETRRSSSPATPDCARKRPTTGTRRSCRRRVSAPATSRSPRSSRGIPQTNAPFLGDLIPAARFDPAALTIQDQFVPHVEPAQQLLRGAAARSAEHRRGDAQARSLPVADAQHSRVSYFYLTGTDTQPLSWLGQHPVGRSRLQVEPAQPQRRRHLDAQPDDDQPAPRHLHAAVRRPREQPDDVARRSELEVHDPGRPDAAAPDRVRLLHRADVDCRARCRQRLLRGEGQP